MRDSVHSSSKLKVWGTAEAGIWKKWFAQNYGNVLQLATRVACISKRGGAG